MSLGLLALLARLILAAVLAVAGILKLRDRTGTIVSLEDFGVPARWAGRGAVLLPIVELLVAAALLPPATAAAGLVGAVLLLAAFSLAVAVNLVRGRAPHCRCFGQLHSAPTSWKTVGRNLALAGLGALSWIADPLRDIPGSRLHGAEVLGAVTGAAVLGLAALGGVFFVRAVRAHGRLARRLDATEPRVATGRGAAPAPAAIGMSPGTPAPAFSATDATTGHRVTRDDLLAPHRPLLLVFTSRECHACKEFLPDVAQWQRTHRERVTIAVASDGNADTAGAEAREFALTHVLVDQDLALYRAFQAYGTPSAVLVHPDAAVGSHVAAGSEAVADLFARVLRGEFDAASPPPVTPGPVVPPVNLSSLER